MKIEFKEPVRTEIKLNTGDILKACFNEIRCVFQVSEKYGFERPYALVILAAESNVASDLAYTPFDVGKITVNGINYAKAEDFVSDTQKLITNLKDNGFENIQVANFKLVEE